MTPGGQSFDIRIGDTVSDGVPSTVAGRFEAALAQVHYTFSYRLRGQWGGASLSTVTVQVDDGADRQSVVVSTFVSGSSSVRVRLLGAPGQTYQVQESGELGGWTNHRDRDRGRRRFDALR